MDFSSENKPRCCWNNPGLFHPSPAKSLMVSAGDIPSRLLQAFNICTVLRPTGRLACFLVSAAAGFRTEKTGQPLVMTDTLRTGQWPWKQLIYPLNILKMMIFHSYVSLSEGKSHGISTFGFLTDVLQKEAPSNTSSFAGPKGKYQWAWATPAKEYISPSQEELINLYQGLPYYHHFPPPLPPPPHPDFQAANVSW